MLPLPFLPPSAGLSPARIRTLVVAVAVGALLHGMPATAQVAPPPVAPAQVGDSLPVLNPKGISPGGAFLRAVLLPGWGHASIGSYNRGAFYFVLEGATAWTLLKTRRRFAEAQDRALFRESVVREGLLASGVTEETAIEEALDADLTLQDLRDLEEARRQQREDWTAVGIFLLFLSGADAYVSAHLQSFPVPLELNAEPAGGGRMELSVGFSLPR